MDKNILLPPRLQKIADLVPACRMVADIGTDHAYIPLYLVKEGRAEGAIASDIKKGPVMRAKENIKKYGMEKTVEARLGAGLETVLPGEASVIIVAGMGGILISDILANSPQTVEKAERLVLQPMTAVVEMRDFLCKNGFGIESEHVVAEEDKLYNIIVATPHGKTQYTKKELYLGRGIDKTCPDVYERYEISIIEKIKRQISGLSESKLPENAEKRKEMIEILNALTKKEDLR